MERYRLTLLNDQLVVGNLSVTRIVDYKIPVLQTNGTLDDDDLKKREAYLYSLKQTRPVFFFILVQINFNTTICIQFRRKETLIYLT